VEGEYRKRNENEMKHWTGTLFTERIPVRKRTPKKSEKVYQGIEVRGEQILSQGNCLRWRFDLDPS
jgi:hypothetical protein